MSKYKLKVFDVKQKINKYLTWSMIGYLVFEALIQVGDFIGMAHTSSGAIVYSLSRITQSGVGSVLLSICSAGTLLYIWEWFRRSLKTVGSKLWYVVLALMVLIACNTILGFMPDGYSTLEQIQNPTRFTSFASSFMTVSMSIQTLLKFILSVGLIIKFRGRISLYAWVSLVCVFVIGDGRYLYNYIYNYGSNSFSQAIALSFVAFKYLTLVIPTVFLRRSMTYTHIKSVDGENDIK